VTVAGRSTSQSSFCPPKRQVIEIGTGFEWRNEPEFFFIFLAKNKLAPKAQPLLSPGHPPWEKHPNTIFALKGQHSTSQQQPIDENIWTREWVIVSLDKRMNGLKGSNSSFPFPMSFQLLNPFKLVPPGLWQGPWQGVWQGLSNCLSTSDKEARTFYPLSGGKVKPSAYTCNTHSFFHPCLTKGLISLRSTHVHSRHTCF
jgi:hypothetical protein